MNKDVFRSLGLLLLRLVAGSCMAYHGFGKLFGGFMPQFIEGVGHMGFPVPVFFAWAAALSEFLGGILVVLGLRTRIASLFVCVVMSVAFFITHKADAFQVKELALVYLAIFASLALNGAGKFSLDRS